MFPDRSVDKYPVRLASKYLDRNVNNKNVKSANRSHDKNVNRSRNRNAQRSHDNSAHQSTNVKSANSLNMEGDRTNKENLLDSSMSENIQIVMFVLYVKLDKLST